MTCAVTYNFVVPYLIFKLNIFIIPLRVSEEDETEGLDASQHNENYTQGTLLIATPTGLREELIS